MAVNDQIKVADYNSIRAKVVGVLGTGSVTYGYGQTLLSSDVSVSNKVTINEWANLKYDIINAYAHQNGSLPTILTVEEGGTIRYSTTDAPVTTYDTLATNLQTNRFSIGAGLTLVTSTVSTSRNGSWSNSAKATVQFYWANANQARYFFNSGGKIRVSASLGTDGTASAQNQKWRDLLSAVGSRDFGASATTTPSNGASWYQCNNSFQTYYSANASSPYGSNSIQLKSRVVDQTLNVTGLAASGEIEINLVDAYTDPGPPAPGDLVDGTVTMNVSVVYPTGILYPLGTGNFTVTNPTFSIGSITFS